MRARKPRWYSLQSMKVRQSWNKYNLFKLVTTRLKPFRFKQTHFQQKWAAKSLTRGYHGANIKESDWSRMFSRRLYSAVDMPPAYLAKYDGSEQAGGRGSGRKDLDINAGSFSRSEKERKQRIISDKEDSLPYVHPWQAKRDDSAELLGRPVRHMTPYMQMAFAPLERRLDVAIFRAMFASSTLQAKQFCTHGAVKVNGKTMRYGAYLLNPGDMFQVDVDSVLYATGRPKTPLHAKWLAGEDYETLRAAKREEFLNKNDSSEAAAEAPAEAEAEASEEKVEAESAAKAEGEEAEGEGEGEAAEATEELTEEQRAAQQKKQLKGLISSAKALLYDGNGLNPRKKRQLRAFTSEVKRALSQAGRTAESATISPDNVIDHLSSMLKDFKLEGNQVEAITSPEQEQQQQEQQESEKAEQKVSAKKQETRDTIKELITSDEVREAVKGLSLAEQTALASLLRTNAENPIDESKPYWTPWEPRRYMAPFAFIPRYLEVNQNICAAVYLRHPVARRGFAEVPTPFSYETNQLAFNWYLRRR
ncbi:37S ribosomal protein NAM9 [Colletotrichum aenigma]|uniref:37S ribosomal protein NAM9 n=1 Tax=Colletotrichum aenigma TaxID=1215731 RepID=UPI001872C8B5|nr:37S ribosomal protein NAM9 [Colletotrichum aenigma]KAF5520127.1 37S ribosomal protein NAM9 [Colletotrichum aenigma]